MLARLDYQDSVLGIEIDYGIEILLIDRLVRLVHEQRYRMVVHFTFHKTPNTKLTGVPSGVAATFAAG